MDMGGIAGCIHLPLDDDGKVRMLSTMKHRGRDREGSHTIEDCTLMSTGRNHNGELLPTAERMGECYCICFDGCVFNRRELSRELGETESDAELVLRGYMEWGPKLLDRINGVFAMAIYEEKGKQLFLARDRIGVKPLFYMAHQGGLLFASEMKTILTYSGVGAKLDGEGAAELLLLGPGRTPGSGVFRGMKEIKPGHYGILKGSNLQLRRYWRLTDRNFQYSLDETAEIVRFLLKDAIYLQMQTDLPVGAMLSGGLDSSLVSAIASEKLQGSGKQLSTFSVDYLDSDKHFRSNYFQPSRDSDFISLMQKHLKSDHHWTVLTPDDLVSHIADATIARDLPGMADVDISLLAFCKEIKPYADTVLSGECADEIFGGYPWYRDEQMRAYDGFPWCQSTHERTAFLAPWILQKIDPAAFVRDRYLQTIQDADILPENSDAEKRIKELVNLNFIWFMQTLLDRGDRMGAFAGVEIRMPFCDYRIAELLYAVPWSMKDHQGQEKGLLRYALKDYLPQEVLYRKKSPYPKTYDPHFEQMVSKMVQELLKQKAAPIFGLIRREALEDMLAGDFQWPWYGQLMRRPQSLVYMLQINYWLDHYGVEISP